jgi:hypothetical protein
MARELFIYWKLDAARLPAAAATTARLQAGLCQAQPGLVARLHRRADVKDGVATLMESYAHPDGVGSELQAAIEAAMASAEADVSPAWRIGPRHTEAFESIVR